MHGRTSGRRPAKFRLLDGRSLLAALVLALTLVGTCSVAAQNAHLADAMYQGVPVSSCLRLLHASGTVGCQTKKGTTGILYQINNNNDLDAFIKDAPSRDYAIVMPYLVFTPSNVAKLRNSKKMAGIILVKDGFGYPDPATWSSDSTCPNCQFGLYSNQPPSSWHQWNPDGNSLSFQDFDFPIFGISQDGSNLRSITPLKEAVEANARGGYVSYPLYAVEFDAFMWAAGNSAVCLQRGWCDPIGGLSVWSTFSKVLDSNNTLNDNKPLIVVSAKIDSKSFISDFGIGSKLPTMAIGARSPKTGLVTALATADALSQYFKSPEAVPLAKHILFTFFDAETWGFAGSQRFVQDITRPLVCKERGETATPSCPLALANCTNPCFYDLDFTSIQFNNIESIIEFDSVGGIDVPNLPPNPTIFMHVDEVNPQTTALMNMFAGTTAAPGFNGSSPLNVNTVPAAGDGVNFRLPPSSAMAFLAKKNIPAVVFGDFRDRYSNRYYNSEFDDGSLWDADNVALMCALANKTARSVFASASGNTTVPLIVSANCTLVAELMNCFTRNLTCSLVAELYPQLIDTLEVLGPPLTDTAYSGTFNYDTNVMPFLINRIMTNLTATERTSPCIRDDQCPTDYACMSYSKLANGTSVGKCTQGFARFHWAYGTGIEKNYQKAVFEVVDPTKPSWTQSKFGTAATNGIRMRLFKVASTNYEALQLGIGCILTVLGIATTILSQRYFRKRFKME
ncbi:uncharacterized protein SPPG_02727 [Spizellomyces punctatus DAOM BR117]|uniref:Nicastrin n=1 Tax=Spizellomyces punctatus (strain DAOM BR117) TaxID=645134 RepID=A0A0L0HLD6_SPIPD|nr:uncharacterized protein SPPG_02727 [Spizellomyces punctatus DAOM BR117]KND02246.1 hypothetical protein SPPG_02727 [Spizellomyces punctatus DAOM BR117]|eukprot:XP_016610285.1 hypothetical protein SPPG_02727 [Spizellomyces punctatus DAOM BR117]